jgi:hypothetical protein
MSGIQTIYTVNITTKDFVYLSKSLTCRLPFFTVHYATTKIPCVHLQFHFILHVKKINSLFLSLDFTLKNNLIVKDLGLKLILIIFCPSTCETFHYFRKGLKKTDLSFVRETRPKKLYLGPGIYCICYGKWKE